MKMLIKLKLRIYINRYKELSTAKKVSYPLIFLAFYLLLFTISALLINHFNLLDNEKRLYHYVFYLSLLMIIFPYEINTVYKCMFEFTDLELFLTCPLKSRSVFIYKNFESALKVFMILFFVFIPSQLYYGIALNMPVFYYFILVMSIFLYCSLIIALIQIFVFLCTRISNPSHRKENITFASGCIGFVSYAFFYLKWDKIDFSALFTRLESSTNLFLFIFKKSYMAIELMLAGNFEKSIQEFLKFSISMIIILSIFILILEQFFKWGWLTASESKNPKRDLKNKRNNWKKRDKKINIYPISLVVKDVRVFFRDMKFWDIFIAPLILFVIFSYTSYIKGTDKSLSVLLLLFSIWVAYRLAINFIINEGEAIFLLKTAPILTKKVVLVKGLVSTSIATVMIVIATLVLVIFFKASFVLVSICFLVSILLASITAILASAYGYTFLQYDKENMSLSVSPEGQLRFWGCFLGLLLLISVMFLISFILMYSPKISILFVGFSWIKYSISYAILALTIISTVSVVYKKYIKISNEESNVKLL